MQRHGIARFTTVLSEQNMEKKNTVFWLEKFLLMNISLLLLYPTSHFCRETTNEIKRTVLNKQKHAHI